MTSMFFRLGCASLSVLWISVATGQDAASLSQAIEGSARQADVMAYVRSSRLYKENSEFRQRIDSGLSVEDVRSLVRAYALGESKSTFKGAGETAKNVKSSPIYRDPGVSESSNWLSRALERLRNLLKPPERRERPNWQAPGFMGPWITWLMWLLLGAAVAVFAYLALKHYRWKLSLQRKSTAVLEENEPERSADEWLEQASRLESEGDFRRAVRCLYLACLLRFDETGVARFDRGQTNWEHLARLNASPRMPRDLDFGGLTKRFDTIWYGGVVKGSEDVRLFRDSYQEVRRLTEGVPA